MQSITQHSPPHTSPSAQEEKRAPSVTAPAPPTASAPGPAPAPPVYEPAARKMEVDENYDDSGDDDKRSVTKQDNSQRNSPKQSNGGGAPTASVSNGNGAAGVEQNA